MKPKTETLNEKKIIKHSDDFPYSGTKDKLPNIALITIFNIENF